MPCLIHCGSDCSNSDRDAGQAPSNLDRLGHGERVWIDTRDGSIAARDPERIGADGHTPAASGPREVFEWAERVFREPPEGMFLVAAAVGI
jgi:hypothetical protein